ncbi:MAG: single-stranded-DNA-specific exonuclease RecJ [Geminicoccaceae bacterium]
MSAAAKLAPATPKPAEALSISGRVWRERAYDPDEARAIALSHDLDELAARVLASRGVSAEAVPGHLTPRLRACLPDPSHLHGMDVAAARLADAVQDGEALGIIADYDVDGASSAAVLTHYLRAVGLEPHLAVPDRIEDGYGPNVRLMDALAEAGCRLVVTLDAGTTAFEALAHAAAAGQEVIVVDHHAAEARLPEALAVINPNRLDQDSPLGNLAAVGVTFVLVVALNRELRARGHFKGAREPDLTALLDLVALGTVCDVVPLTGLNRAFVVQGLKVAARGGTPGLSALAKACKIDGALTASHCGFQLGPRINAGGRIGRADLGARLLSATDGDEARAIACALDELNERRRQVEQDVLAFAIDAVERQVDRGDGVIIAQGQGWHPGVIGIVAARLVERYGRPTFVIGFEGGEGKGSGRSLPGFDMGAVVIAARHEGLLSKAGGHAMAAGLSLPIDRLAAFRRFVDAAFAKACADASASHRADPATPIMELDGALALSALTPRLADQIDSLAPYGAGYDEPLFVLPDVRIADLRVVGRYHLATTLEDVSGARHRAIAFRCSTTALGKALRGHDGGPLDVAGRITRNTWQGRTQASFVIQDIRLR